MTEPTTPSAAPDPALRRPLGSAVLERKVQTSALALFVERLWPRLWLIVSLAALFTGLSLAGLWPLLGESVHRIVVALFALGLIASILWLASTPYPTRDDALRRLETGSDLPHRPATSYEDTLSAGATDPATATLWQAHRARLHALVKAMRVKAPAPRTDRADPWAIRVGLLVGVAALIGLAGDSARDRLMSAFRFGPAGVADDSRIDAWIAPPAYTGRPPLMLADGAHPGTRLTGADGKPIAVPTGSIVVVRSSNGGRLRIALPSAPGRPADQAAPDALPAALAPTSPAITEAKATVTASGPLVITRDGTETGRWMLGVIPDTPPTIALVKEPEVNPRGALKLSYLVADDYGVVAAGVKLEKLPPRPGDPAQAWARLALPKGPRLPLERAPALALRLPRANAKSGEAQTHLELASHPWSGLPVRMTLTATDGAGQVGHSESREMILPGRRFEKPFARAIVEQRRVLMDDPRRRPEVLRALNALTLAPEEFIRDTRVYLALRDAIHQIDDSHVPVQRRNVTRTALKSAADALWHVALRIEDGDLSEAERALKEAQDKLAKALENGASDKEIEALMKDLKQALNTYLDQLNKQAENREQPPPGDSDKSQQLSSQDLDKMMKNIEDMAKNGSREQAQQMLSEMRDLLDRLQTSKQAEAQAKQSREAMKKMDELSKMTTEQQKLMDETYAEQREQEGQEGQQQGMGQPGQQGQRAPSKRGQRGQGQQQGPGQQGKDQQGQKQPGQNQPGQNGSLGDRQGALRQQLDKLQRDMKELGMGSDKLDAAREAMESAEKSLQDKDLEQATEDEGRALDNMRQGAQSMAQQMMKNMPRRFGQPGDTPRDPMGRPQRTEGPQMGDNVKVPDEIDMQRAREILEELRKRSGEATRPPEELDYLERLLKRF